MRIVMPGGSGVLGRVLARHLGEAGHEVIVLSRKGAGALSWDGRSSGPWEREIDGADAVVNLAGRSVNCRYTRANLRDMMDSRILSARAVGEAIRKAARPPRTWLQMSTATIYTHRHDAANDERDGRLGGSEPGAPASWRVSTDIAAAWEAELEAAQVPRTRKVALRTAMVMGVDPDGTFAFLRRIARLGLGGAIAGGRQFMSWIHERDFARAVEFLLEKEAVSGTVNLAAPHPLTQREFMAALREALGIPLGLPAARWMLEVGTFLLRTESELILKSRRVVPRRLLEEGFAFEFADWPAAARDLARRMAEAPATRP